MESWAGNPKIKGLILNWQCGTLATLDLFVVRVVCVLLSLLLISLVSKLSPQKWGKERAWEQG